MRKHHPKGTQVPLALVVTYVKQLADALQYAHTQRLIHRDVKPANVLLGCNGELLLGDFGASLLMPTSKMLDTQNVIGTFLYTAPEQLKGKPVPASDQYALGVVVYEWLCGQCPFQGTTSELYYQHLYEQPPSLRTQIPTISPAVEQVVMKALAKQPEQRYKNVQAFADALEQASKPVLIPSIYSRRAVVRSIIGLVAMVGVGTGVVTIVKHPFSTTNTIEYNVLRINHYQNEVYTVAWSSDSNSIASAGGSQATRRGDTDIYVQGAETNDSEYMHVGHSQLVRMVAWSPDSSNRIASASEDHTVKVWTAFRESSPLNYTGHTDKVMALAWSPDGTQIASASSDLTVQIWNSYTGVPVHTIYISGTKNDQIVTPVAWSPNGTMLAFMNENWKAVDVWSATSEKRSTHCPHLPQASLVPLHGLLIVNILSQVITMVVLAYGMSTQNILYMFFSIHLIIKYTAWHGLLMASLLPLDI